uniref:MIF4G domain-containing protein n=1 Tax=viral metagenome TaxID=1070528 RepID=A0A6C0L3B3_9ZZZZ|tara:strand:+ start:2402 stop:3181 length:780 start_codon:yes stop_codon:yes gene_type:complete
MSIQEVQEIFETEDFKQKYNSYLSDLNSEELINFLDNIETNKKYYRMNIHKNKRYKKETTQDTSSIKQINCDINKLTDCNYHVLKPKIIEQVNSVDYIIPYLIENIVENSILHHIYIPLYVGIIKDIKCSQKDKIIQKACDSYFVKLFQPDIQGATPYERLCVDNKNTDNIIGFSLFIAHMEKEGMIQGFITKVITTFMSTIESKNNNNQHKLLVSFYNISKIHFPDGIPSEYQQQLRSMKQTTQSSKIRFKIMDILDE